MTDCCIPQQNPTLYLFTHRVIHNHQCNFCIFPTVATVKIVITIEREKFDIALYAELKLQTLYQIGRAHV